MKLFANIINRGQTPPLPGKELVCHLEFAAGDILLFFFFFFAEEGSCECDTVCEINTFIL